MFSSCVANGYSLRIWRQPHSFPPIVLDDVGVGNQSELSSCCFDDLVLPLAWNLTSFAVMLYSILHS